MKTTPPSGGPMLDAAAIEYVADLRERAIADAARSAARQFDWLVLRRTDDGPESPIERRFLAALFANGWEFPDQLTWMDARSQLENLIGDPRARMIITSDFGWCTPQLPVVLDGRSMRLDVAIVTWDQHGGDRIAVELDGHDFHERTKAQARADRSRDRLLQRHGWHVVRFTGSEVHNDVDACVDELTVLLSRLGDQHAESVG